MLGDLTARKRYAIITSVNDHVRYTRIDISSTLEEGKKIDVKIENVWDKA